ncbi:Aluminum-activated malate transporter [Trema orientale]|uniref:Aluminum-activated malate transporter n=1 Tax=Trema orientale TaxID=63057 RepID=A0A2P5FU79_TREOI|nr:Aluminum-activated malate transporter [Trema orientale]
MASPCQQNSGTRPSIFCKLWGKVVQLSLKLKKLGEEDPRRIVHSFKVGLAITLVSLFYYFKPLYDGFGVAAMWAVLTVVVIFEFSVGATLGKGFNRVLATSVAGALGVGTHCIATLSGESREPLLLALFVFIIAAVVTFLRFFPEMKARYDYGLMIFILTFSLVSVSAYRDDEVIDLALTRLNAIMIGTFTTVVICVLIRPVWIGVEFHKLIAGNLEKLGNFLDGFADEYFLVSEKVCNSKDKSFLEGYKSVLTSKSNEETMAHLARWEPGHGRFRLRHPWTQYLKVGNLARQCAYKIETLNSYLRSEIQTPQEDRIKINEPCKIISSECGKAIKKLASTIRKMEKTSDLAEPHIANSKAAAENLKTILKAGPWKDSNPLEIMPAATVASLLLEVISCTEKVVEAVHELESLAHFKISEQRLTPENQPESLAENQKEINATHDHLVITMDG